MFKNLPKYFWPLCASAVLLLGGTAYSEKARYCRTFKLITPDDYSRLFNLATKDHEQAIALAPESAEAYFNRGRTYYDRGTVEQANSKDAQLWLNLAGGDFQKTIDKDRRQTMGWDMLGLVLRVRCLQSADRDLRRGNQAVRQGLESRAQGTEGQAVDRARVAREIAEALWS